MSFLSFLQKYFPEEQKLDGNGREFHRDSLKEVWLKDTVFQIHFLQLKVKMYIIYTFQAEKWPKALRIYLG